MADHDLKPLALRQLGFDDTASSSAQLSFLDSSATGVLPSDPDHFSNDIDLSILLEGTEPLTEAALKNSCVSQDPVSEDLLARDETSSCPAPVPLAPANEQIFNDPLNWLERTLLDDKPPSTYPGRLSPEEEQEREDDPDGQYWNTNSIDGEEWHEYNPCEPYLELGYINALCCSGRSSLVTDLSVIMVWFMKYEWVKDCDPSLGRFFLSFVDFEDREKGIKTLDLSPLIEKPSLGTFCTAQYDICCRDYVSVFHLLYSSKIVGLTSKSAL